MKFYVPTKTKIRLGLFLFTLLMLSCNQYSPKQSNDQSNDKIFYSDKKEVINPVDKINLKVIKSAKTKYKVANVKSATRKIKKLAKNYNGYISDLQFQNNLYRIENRFTIKIPKEHFDVFLDSIHNYITFIDYENINTKDVTEDYFDASSRLKTKQEVKIRYEEILRKKAKTVDDVLNTEEKLRVIQEEIEATTGKLIFLKNRISFSTIDIELYEEVDYKPEPKIYNKSFFNKAKEGFVNGGIIISTILIAIVNIWPLLILGIIGFLIYKRRKKE
jgi:hypothetical protein